MQSKGVACPAVWLGCAAARLAGHTHGAWCAADQGVDDLRTAVDRPLATSPMPGSVDFYIGDVQDLPDLGADMTLDRIASFGELVAEYGPNAVDVLEHLGGDVDTARAYLEDGIEIDDVRTYVIDLFTEVHVVRDVVAAHIDFDMLVEDFMADRDAVDLSDGRVLLCPL